MEKEYKRVSVEQVDEYRIKLIIELKHHTDFEWEQCYRNALIEKGTYTSMRASGAPTVDKVSFFYDCAYTRDFPNNKMAQAEAKVFLDEFNDILVIADSKYESLQKQKEINAKKKEEADKEQKEEIKRLNEYFNQ